MTCVIMDRAAGGAGTPELMGTHTSQARMHRSHALRKPARHASNLADVAIVNSDSRGRLGGKAARKAAQQRWAQECLCGTQHAGDSLA
jgi:hypothetical protein